MKPRLLGLTGAKTVGKTTFANLLFPDFVRISFADPIRDGLLAMGLLSPEDLLNKEKPSDWLGHSPRFLMQTLGTEWGRTLINPEIWIMIAERRITDRLVQGISVVVDDVRFDNEAALIHRLGGQVALMTREGVGRDDGHASESGVSDQFIDSEINQVEPFNKFTALLMAERIFGDAV